MKDEALQQATAHEKALLADLTRKRNESWARLAALNEKLAAINSDTKTSSQSTSPSAIEVPTTAVEKISLFRQLSDLNVTCPVKCQIRPACTTSNLVDIYFLPRRGV